MSHYMTALAMKQVGIKPAAKIVLYWLSDHHNSETDLCFPSLKTLERECEMNRSTIVRHLDALETGGLISRDQRTRDNGSQTSTAYTLHLVPVAERNTPCCKTQQPPVAKRDPHNLGILNLGNEPREVRDISVKSFDAFWAIVPRKVAKASAQKAYTKALTQTDAQTIFAAMQRYADERGGKDEQYTAHPATWLNAGRWLDAPPAHGATDFHNQVSQMLKGSPDGLPVTNETDHRTPERLSAPLPPPRSFGR